MLRMQVIQRIPATIYVSSDYYSVLLLLYRKQVIWQEEAEQDPYFTGADFDRVGMSAALRQAYPVEIRCVDIQDGSGGLRLSDHRGLRIRIGDGAGTISPERTRTGS
jgi:hypothetical protein